MHETPIGPESVAAAAQRLAPWANRTPVMQSRTLNSLCDGTVAIKCENFQRSGSFKFRGAMNAVLSLSDEARARGVVTHSSGNHGQALALAGKLLGVGVTVVSPRTAPAIKLAAIEGYGARLVLCEPTFASREEHVSREIAHHGLTLVHPFNDWSVIAGQGTAAAELIAEAGPFDVVMCPVGGSGLLAGTSLAARAASPTIRVWGAEPAAADDARRSLEAGVIHTSADPVTIADGLRSTAVGERPFSIFSRIVERIATATEPEIIAATRFVWERMKLVAEPSCAVPIATILSGAAPVKGLRVGVILSGGNVDLSALARLLAESP